MPFVQAHVDDGKLHSTVGPPGQKTLISDARWVALFLAAGVPAAFEADMLLSLRCHAPLCVAFESASVAGVRREAGVTWGGTMRLARGAHESFSLVRGLGFRLYPRGKGPALQQPGLGAWQLALGLSRVRSFRELLVTGVHECRALVDAMVAAAQGSRVPVQVARIEAMRS